jgi:rubrerythrin
MQDFGSIEDVLDFAINREIEAYDFYTKLTVLAKKPDVSKELKIFAEDELEHRTKLESVKSGEIKLDDDEIGSLGIAEKVKNVEATAEMTYVDLLVIGMKKEKDSFQLYKQLASTVRKDQLKGMFQQMAREEAQHKLTLEIEYDLTTF